MVKPQNIVPPSSFLARGLASVAGTSPPSLSNHGGSVIGAVQVVPIYWGAAWEAGTPASLATQLDAFFDFIVTSALIDLLAEYSTPTIAIKHGSRAASVHITATEPGTVTAGVRTVTDAQIQTALQGWIANGAAPATTANTLYFVYLPPSVVSSLGTSQSCTGYCGYHNHIGGAVYYAVVPYVDCGGCLFSSGILDTLTEVSSHELCEAITDPTLQTWYDNSTGDEIGDLCNRQSVRMGSYLVQAEWSNSQSACVYAPAVTAGWHHDDLTAATGAPLAVGAVSGYMFEAQGTQHVDYRSADGHIHEFWWDPNGWHHDDITAAAGAPGAAGDPTGYLFAAQGTQHVHYRGTDGHIHELWWDPNGWHHDDLTAATGAAAATGNPKGYMFTAQGTQHVHYRGVDGHIHEFWWDASGWHHDDITAVTGAPLAAGAPTGYMFDAQGTQHVDYRGVDGHIHEFWWDPNGWHHDDITAATGAPSAAGDPFGYMFDAQGTQHIHYRGVDGHIHEFWWDPSGWHHDDLTAATGVAVAAGNPAGYMFRAQGTQHVDYQTADGHVHEFWWDPAGWHQDDITAATGAPPTVVDPKGYMFTAQGTQHVNFRSADGHVHELWWG